MKLYMVYLFLFINPIIYANNGGDDLMGYWLSETNDYIVEVYKKDSLYYGKIVWMVDSLNIYNQPTRDVLNSESQKRSRLVKGLDVLDGFEFEEGVWKSGIVYNYKTGNDYNGRLRIDDEGNLRLTGYYGILFFFGKTKVWTRVDEITKYKLD